MGQRIHSRVEFHNDSNKIGRITINGHITEFSIPTPHSHPLHITPGADSTLWFTEESGNKIGRISVEGGNVTIIEFLIPRADSLPVGIIDSSNDTLWFTEIVYNRIGNVMIQGQEAHFHVDRSDPSARFFGYNHPLSALALYWVSSPTLLKSERM